MSSIDSVHYIISIMANMINYLNVSLYESKLTYYHEQARLNLNLIYDIVSKTPNQDPGIYQISAFYNNIRFLFNVTETDDQDYYIYMRALKKYINANNNTNV
jgi:hypothetical protein